MRHATVRGRGFLLIAILLGLGGSLFAAPGGIGAQDAGWFGPFDDGCSYYWDGVQYTGDLDCSAVGGGGATAGYPAGWYDASGDGCRSYYDGAQ